MAKLHAPYPQLGRPSRGSLGAQLHATRRQARCTPSTAFHPPAQPAAGGRRAAGAHSRAVVMELKKDALSAALLRSPRCGYAWRLGLRLTRRPSSGSATSTTTRLPNHTCGRAPRLQPGGAPDPARSAQRGPLVDSEGVSVLPGVWVTMPRSQHAAAR